MTRGARFLTPAYPATRARAIARQDRVAHAMGASFWQTPGGIQSEMDVIDADIRAFSAELARTVGALDPMTVAAAPVASSGVVSVGAPWWSYPLGGAAAFDALDEESKQIAAAREKVIQKQSVPAPTTDTKKQRLGEFFTSAWIPFANGWRGFYEQHHGWTDNFFWNHAPEAEQFSEKLVELRKKARDLGMDVATPAPTKWGKSLLDPTRAPTDTALDAASEMAKIVKYVAIGAVGLVGLTVAVSLGVNARKSSDPVAVYSGLARRRGK